MKKLIQLVCLYSFMNGAFAQKTALHFDGVNDYIPITGTTKLNGPSKITLETWVYVTNANSSPCGNCAPIIWNQQNSYRFGTGNTKLLFLSVLNGSTTVTLTSANTFSDLTWHHIAATFSGTKMKLYVDGTATDSTTYSSFSITYPGSSSDVWIADPVTGYAGILEETRIWDYDRTTAQINEGMNRSYGSSEPGLVLQYSYNDGTPYANNTGVTKISDKTTNAHHGTPTNFALQDSVSNFVLGRSYCDTIAYAKFSVTRCVKYQLPSKKKTVIVSGVYKDTITSYRGCDSVMTITVKIIKPSAATVYLAGCDSVQSPIFKSYYKKSGKYNVTIMNHVGCDSVIAFFITVYKKDTTKLNYDVCMVADLSNGKTVTSSGIYVDSLKGFRGCDSFVIHTVKIRNSSTSSATLTLCKFVVCPTDPDKIFRKAGTYYDTIQNSVSCDSIIEYKVLSQASSATLNVQSCGNYKSPSKKYTWTTSGTYFDTLAFGNSQGCDSFMTINLNIVAAIQKTLNITECRRYVVPSGSKVITGSGTHSDVIKTKAGCDSIQYTLNVTINNANTSYTRSGNTLTANSTTAGAAFQWLDCNNNKTAISGQTNKSFSPGGDGNFALAETELNCTDTSACQTFAFLSTREFFRDGIAIFPNPAKGSLTIRSVKALHNVKISFMGLTGESILTLEMDELQQRNIELDLPPAFYLVRIESAEGYLVKYLMIE